CELATLSGVRDELEALAASNRHARAALGLLDRVNVVHREGPADEALLALASRDDIVCTNDKVLKEKIRRRGAPVIYLRQGRRLAVDGYI
ncbi:MAG: twitching motility protein PilT, partial [Euryarchaeota archaeon]|nr:twitching motility protein PilT [Euryarchaeota archaeon]